ncbi:putative zinc-binding protein [Dehalobacter restrictus]|jgi:uncharacterized metal-binding protein|uniref:putative zinc-binding protein n=1 Tax=Dehalobacter restrictus TaxID=55583 RepID=UPI00338FA1B8
MPDNCERMICFVACPGGSNVSLLANQAIVLLEEEGYGKAVRVAGEQHKEKDMARLANAAKSAKQWILIEGCSKECGLKILDSAGIKPDKHFLITSLGIEREYTIDYSQDELEQVLSAIKDMID